MADPPAPDQWGRRLLWLLAAAALLVLFIAFWRRDDTGGARVEERGRTRVTHDFVIERVEEVAKLVSSETRVRDVVGYENTRFGSTKRSLVVATGRVLAGIDLKKGTDVRIDDAARRITITLPRAEILGVEVVNLRTYDERSGLLNPFRPADRDTIYQRVRAQLQRAGEELGVIEHAERSAETMLETLLSADGYGVEVVFRAPLEVRAPRG